MQPCLAGNAETHGSKESGSGVAKNEREAQYNGGQWNQGRKRVWAVEYEKTDENDRSEYYREKYGIQFRDDGPYVL